MKNKAMKAGTVCCCEALTSLEAFMVSSTEDGSQCRILHKGSSAIERDGMAMVSTFLLKPLV